LVLVDVDIFVADFDKVFFFECFGKGDDSDCKILIWLYYEGRWGGELPLFVKLESDAGIEIQKTKGDINVRYGGIVWLDNGDDIFRINDW